MIVMRIFVIILCSFSYNCLPTDTVQFKLLGVVGTVQNEEQVLVNGVILSDYGENINSILRAVSVDGSLHQALAVDKLNQTLAKNRTLVRLRECILVGSRVHYLKDRVIYNGDDYLILNQATYKWKARENRGLEVLRLWHQELEHTKQETRTLSEGCLNLMQELHLSKRTGVLAAFAPVLAIVAFLGLLILSLFISKKQGPAHTGAGVIGSILYYHWDRTNVPAGEKDYQVL